MGGWGGGLGVCHVLNRFISSFSLLLLPAISPMSNIFFDVVCDSNHGPINVFNLRCCLFHQLDAYRFGIKTIICL